MADSIMDTMSDDDRLEELSGHFRKMESLENSRADRIREMEDKLAEPAQEKECELKTNKEGVTDNRMDAELKKMVNDRFSAWGQAERSRSKIKL